MRELGQCIRRERLHTWRTLPEFGQACGLSARTLGNVERGARPSYAPFVYAAIEDTLGWEPGSCELIRDGGTPRRSDPYWVRVSNAWPRLDTGSRRMLAHLAETSIKD